MEKKEINTKSQGPNSDEIDLIEVALKLWAERKLIVKTVVVFFILGIIVAFGSKKEYKAECTFILDDNQGGSRVSGLLAQFGGLAGINLGGQEGQGTISPELYPNIVKSTPFMLELLESEITIEKFDTTVSVFNYFNELEKPSFLGYVKKFTIRLPGTILGVLRGNKDGDSVLIKNENQEILKLTKDQEDIIKGLSERISINLDEKTGIINLGVELPDPLGAAQLVNITYKNLTEYLIEYKIDKATVDYNFINDRYLEAKDRYENAQNNLALFRDRNMNPAKASAQTQENRLQSEYQLTFDVYNGLAQQLEQAKIKVQEAMPVFKIVNRVKVPLEKSKPKKSLIFVISIFLGFFLGIFAVIILMIYRNLKKNIILNG